MDEKCSAFHGKPPRSILSDEPFLTANTATGDIVTRGERDTTAIIKKNTAPLRAAVVNLALPQGPAHNGRAGRNS